MEKKLTPKQKLFVQEYPVDMCATQAAIRAGYSIKTANRIASENLSKPVIQKAIADAMEERMKRLQADADYVLQRLIAIDKMSIIDIMNDDMTIKPLSEWPTTWLQSIHNCDVSEIWEGTASQRQLIGLLKKIRWPDKLKNLELLGKHVDIQAFKEKRDIDLGLPTVILHDPGQALDDK